MHPTTEEQLAAVRRLLDDVAADAGLSERSRATLQEAASRLRRVERGAAARLPFLVADNEACRSLLAELDDLTPDIAAAAVLAVEAGVARGADHHEPSAHQLNKELRGLLARAVRELPDGDGGAAWRRRLAGHLRTRTATDPSINRPRTGQGERTQ